MSERWARVKEVVADAAALPAAARASWIAEACAGDDALRAEVESLLRSHDAAGDFMAGPAIAHTDAAGAVLTAAGAAPLPERFGAYRILRELGRGGMGVVYLGQRDDALFEKQVAIKIVPGDRVHPAVFRRFQEERRILAALDHPNIARLLDAGTTDAGVAYVVMEHVDGAAIDDYCAQWRLSVRERLGLFLQVCAAVQYSHQHLVVHRDIKPRNILVTADGVPKLLDFGIAKLLEPGRDAEDATRTAFRALTPEGASPEQVRGDPITVASDVYALGVLVYRLLAERSPYRGDLGTQAGLVRAVCQEEPLRPSEAASRSDLRGDLDLIALKALRKDPARRYASVEQLAEDVRRHLERRPILAAPDAWAYRARKFAARHWVGLTSAAAVTVALAAGGAATLWQARRAERRFNDVRKLARTFMFDVHDAIAKLPGSTAARKLLVTQALTYLDSLAREAGGNAALQRDLAAGYDKMADVLGRSGTANLGDQTGALAAYQKAQTVRQRLLADDPGDRELRRDSAATSAKVALLLYRTGDMPRAVEEARKASAEAEAVAASPPTEADALVLAMSYSAHGYLLGASGRTVESLARIRKAISLLEPFPAPSREVQLQLVRTYGDLGDVLESGVPVPGLVPDARALLASRLKVLSLAEALAQADPMDSGLQRRVYFAQLSLADALVHTGDRTAAVGHYRLALTEAGRLSAADPVNLNARRDLAYVGARLGTLLAQDGQPAEALALLERSAGLLEAVVAADPPNLGPRSVMAETSIGLGYAHMALASSRTGTADRRRAHWREARTQFEAGAAFWVEARQRGLTAGVESEKPELLAREIAKCDAALAR